MKKLNDCHDRIDTGVLFEDVASKSRRRALRHAALLTGIAATQLPSRWQQPVINSVMLPAHAQTSAEVTAPPVEAVPGFTIARIGTDFRVPSGETVAILAVSRIRLSACGLPGNVTVNAQCFAILLGGTEIECVASAANTTAGGNLTVNEIIPDIMLLPVGEVRQLRYELAWPGGTESVLFDTDALDAAISGTQPAASCR